MCCVSLFEYDFMMFHGNLYVESSKLTTDVNIQKIKRRGLNIHNITLLYAIFHSKLCNDIISMTTR